MVEGVVMQRGPSLRSRLLAWWLRLTVRPVMTLWPLRGRWFAALAMLDRLGRLIPVPRGTVVKRVNVGDCPAEIVHGPGVRRGDGIVLYLPGGAFLMCGLNTHRSLISRISSHANVPVLAVAYRKLPKAPLKESLNDCLVAYRWLLGEGYSADQIVVMGDSAGGHLALALVQALRREHLPQPSAVVGLSPWLDFDCDAKIAHPNARRDAYIPAKRMPEIAAMVCDGPPRPHHSPVNGDLSGHPPTFLQVSSAEALFVDAHAMAERLTAAAVPCRLEVWPGQVHVFQASAPLVPEAVAAIASIGSYVRDALSRAAVSSIA